MADVEYVVLEQIRCRAEESVVDSEMRFVADPEGDFVFWQEIRRVTAARKNLVLRDHTPENGIFNAFPAGDWDAAVEVGTESIPKRTIVPLKLKEKLPRKKKNEGETPA